MGVHRRHQDVSEAVRCCPVLDLSRDPREENPATSRAEETPHPTAAAAGLTVSSSENSLTEARRRALARLAAGWRGSLQPSDAGRRPLPRKLDPIYYDSDEERISFTYS